MSPAVARAPASAHRVVAPPARPLPKATGLKPATLEEIVPFFKADALIQALKNTVKTEKMVSALQKWAEQDAFSTLNAIRFGEIAYTFMLQPLSVQQEFTTKLCEANGIEPPTYPKAEERKAGRQETGRNQFAHAVYGKYKEMFEIRPGSRDTIAGKRVSACIRLYKVSAGLIMPRQPRSGAVAAIPKTGAQMFVVLLSFATEDEAMLLDELAKRAGIDEVTIARWHRNFEQQLKAEVPEAETETEKEAA